MRSKKKVDDMELRKGIAFEKNDLRISVDEIFRQQPVSGLNSKTPDHCIGLTDENPDSATSPRLFEFRYRTNYGAFDRIYSEYEIRKATEFLANAHAFSESKYVQNFG